MAATGPSQADFERAIDTPFALQIEGPEPVVLTLVEVTPNPAPKEWEAFSLLFDGPLPMAFDLSIYTVTHEAMGSFDLCVGPVQSPGGQPRYEAVFNRPSPNGTTD